jgi:hypothetical protein
MEENMNIVTKMVSMLAILSWAGAANAGDVCCGQVSNIIAQPGGQMFFDVAGTHNAKPGCATSDRWVINTSTPGGQSTAATLLTAFSLKRPVAVHGSGACDVWGDTETVFYLILPN